MRQHFLRAVSIILLALSTARCHAEVVTIDGTVKSVDAKKRTITVETGSKTQTLDVSSKAKISGQGNRATLESLRPGQKVRLSYHKDLEIVLKIEATPTGESSGTEAAQAKMISLFDGKTLKGWTVRGGIAKFKAEDGMIVGTSVGGSPNTFLCKGPFSDFVLEFDVLCDREMNSGVQIRSHVRHEQGHPNGVVYGYQCEIALNNSGNFYDEGRHGDWWDDFSTKPEAARAYKADQWNHFRIVAQGDHIWSWINGVACADFHDATDASGLIGLQVHGFRKGMGPYQVRFKNLRIRELKPDEKLN